MDDRTLSLLDSAPPGLPPGEALVGVLDRITFQSADNGFVIGRLLLEGKAEPITIKGNLGAVVEGQTLRVWGEWEAHRDYGLQLKVSRCQQIEPTTLEGMERYLASNVHGVGRRTARRILEVFGRDTFAIIEREPERLLTVPKITRRVVANLKATWAEQKAVREVMVFLHGLGISQGYADRIYKEYGQGSVEVLKTNPYRLAMDVRGIGFRIADSIAKKLGIAHDSAARVEAGLHFVISELEGDGHTAYPDERLIERGAQVLEVPAPLVRTALEALLLAGSLKAHASGAERYILRNRFERAESHIADALLHMLTAEPAVRFEGAETRLGEMERETGIYLDPEQRQAVLGALENPVLILTGGPGTGKTTIIRFILGLAKEGGSTIALAAPTGKAAKRMAEATGHEASTIHRLLQASRQGWGRNAENPIEGDLVIIDESSMIDTLLMDALLAAIPPSARLVLVGDVDQLPSVGAGMVLEDLISSGRFPVFRLEHIHRQSERSRITFNAHHIRRGEEPDLARPPGEELTDFYFIPEGDPEKIVARIRELVTQRIPERFGLDARNDVQVLSPMHKGLTGAQNLNRILQEALNPNGEELSFGDKHFRVGDRVMQIKNDYDKDVFNGDMGEIAGWDAEEGELEVRFDGNPVRYPRKDLDQLMLCYTITVHKAQGSEYPAVVLPFTTHHAIMLQRNLLYTAITRGRKLVVLIGTEKAVNMAVANARRDPRYTCLRPRLVEGAPHPPTPSPKGEGEDSASPRPDHSKSSGQATPLQRERGLGPDRGSQHSPSDHAHEGER